MNCFIGAACILAAVAGTTDAAAQTFALSGQASGWGSLSSGDRSAVLTGARYIPELTAEQKLDAALSLDADLSVNAFLSDTFVKGRHPDGNAKLKAYRATIRLVSDVCEIRAGLQKINFGPSTLFRPLMWFDTMDPRDPLQLTDGVYGLLARYYFLNNANVWLWGLCGNDGTKGWETVPTRKRTVEYGGRIQTPLWDGESGVSYHHREADMSAPAAAAAEVPEDRFALDGKWDLGIGAWFEAVLTHERTALTPAPYQRQWTLGADYTFDVGNGLTVLAEYFRSEQSATALGTAAGIGFSGLSLTYPLGPVDRVMSIVYRDWKDRAWYRLLTWQRTYDNWIIYILGFRNPDAVALHPTQVGTNPFAGSGFELMVVFNH